MMQDPAWTQRVEQLWAGMADQPEQEFLASMHALVAELSADDARGPFQLGSAYDSTGHPEEAVASYRKALELGLPAPDRRRAVIQLASSLRNLDRVEESIALLTAERAAASDELDDAVAAFLALALTSAGREREAVAVSLTALAPHLKRYTRSVKAYASELADGPAGGG